jgi:hypothetical protein
MSFGINPTNVYANDGVENPAFWTVFPGGTHGQIVSALQADTAVQAAIQAKLNDPNNVAKRNFVIHHIDRATVNCIGQRVVGQALAPENASFTLYNLLAGGTADAIDQVIGSPNNTALHNAFAANNSGEIIDVISRQTGRALFQTCISQLSSLNAANIIANLKAQLEKAAKGIVP